jgi:hypothetical protein
MMARLRLLFALFVMAVGTWFGALAISGYYEPHMMMHAEPAIAPAGLSASADTAQFISLVSRDRFVAVEAPVAAVEAKPKAVPKPIAKAKPPATDKRPQQQAAARLPWPLSLFGN